MKAGREYSLVFLMAASSLCAIGCFSPDPRTVDGALAYAARAAEQGDRARLFRILEEPARHALDATIKLRHEAAGIIRATYPPSEVEVALRDLGDAVEADTSEALFAKRCDSGCLAWFSRNVGAPRDQRRHQNTVQVRTIRDTLLTLRLGNDGWYGIAWNTQELAAERERAARDLTQVQENARVYGQRKRLEPTN